MSVRPIRSAAANRQYPDTEDPDGLVQPVRQGASVVYHLTDMRLIEALTCSEPCRDRIYYRELPIHFRLKAQNNEWKPSLEGK
jgi:hypothetical protein